MSERVSKDYSFKIDFACWTSTVEQDDRTGTLDFDQMCKLWDEIVFWKVRCFSYFIFSFCSINGEKDNNVSLKFYLIKT